MRESVATREMSRESSDESSDEASEASEKMVRIAAIGDLHCTRKSQGAYQKMFRHISSAAEVLVLCGDLTDYGLPEEAHILAAEIRAGLSIPVVAVLGNHDYESGQERDVHDILLDAGVMVLDGDACEVNGVGFAGIKGFCGGFGDRSVEPWGERILKTFVEETVHEALKLESALARLSCPTRVAVLHYSPVVDTVQGEPPEIHAFLGSRRLEEPLNRLPVAAVLHGHCHHGSLEGQTTNGTPVYNVAMPLLRRLRPEGAPFRVLELPRHRSPHMSAKASDSANPLQTPPLPAHKPTSPSEACSK